MTSTSSSLPPRTAARRCDLRNLRRLLAEPRNAHEQALRCGSGSYVTHRSTGEPPFIPVTNTIEALHRQIRKAIKTRVHLPDQQAATKLMYLAIIKADAKWQRSRTWSAPRAALKIHFKDRYPG